MLKHKMRFQRKTQTGRDGGAFVPLMLIFNFFLIIIVTFQMQVKGQDPGAWLPNSMHVRVSPNYAQ